MSHCTSQSVKAVKTSKKSLPLDTPAPQICIHEKYMTSRKCIRITSTRAFSRTRTWKAKKYALVNLLMHKKVLNLSVLDGAYGARWWQLEPRRFTFFSLFILLGVHEHLKMPGSPEKLHCHLHIYNVMYFLFYFNWKTHPTIQPKSVPISHLLDTFFIQLFHVFFCHHIIRPPFDPVPREHNHRAV